MFLLLEGMADGEVPLHGDDREAHDLNGLRQRVRERLHATEASVRPGLRSANGKKGSYDINIELNNVTNHEFNVVSDEGDGHQRHFDDDGEQVGEAEAEDGPVDARVAERLCPQNGGDDERVADEAEDKVEGGERPDDGRCLEGDAHCGAISEGGTAGELGYLHAKSISNFKLQGSSSRTRTQVRHPACCLALMGREAHICNSPNANGGDCDVDRAVKKQTER